MRILYVTLAVVLTDQITKLIVKGFSFPFLNIKHDGMMLYDKIEVIGSFFRITFVENPGMAFGIGLGTTAKLLVSLFSVVASIGLIYYLFTVRNQSLSLRLSLALILGGAIGNLIDRVFYGVFYGYAPLFYGKVVDFLDFDFINLSLFGYQYDRFPVFNVADMSVSIGVFILILFYKKHQEETEKKIDEVKAETDDLFSSAENIEESELIENTSTSEDYKTSKGNDENDETGNREDLPV